MTEPCTSGVKLVSWPEKEPKGPKAPPWWRTFWMPVGVVVEYRGRCWEKIERAAADQVWRQWAITKRESR